MGLDRDRSAVPFVDDAAGDVEPEPGSPAYVLRGEEGVECVRSDLRGHPLARVADLDHGCGGFRAGHKAKRAIPMHGIDRVSDEVGPHLVQLAGVRLDAWCRLVEVTLDAHAGAK